MSKREDDLQRRRFREEACGKASHPEHPLRVLTDGKGKPHNWKPYSIGENGVKIDIEQQPGVYTDGDQPGYIPLGQDAGHTTPYRPGMPNYLALEASGPNRRDGALGVQEDKESVIVEGASAGQEVPIHRATLSDLERMGLISKGTEDASQPSNGWQIDMGVTGRGDDRRSTTALAHSIQTPGNDQTESCYGGSPPSKEFSFHHPSDPMHTQSSNAAAEQAEQARRSREIAEQNQTDLSQSSFSARTEDDPNQNQDQARQEPEAKAEVQRELFNASQTQAQTSKEPELEIQQAGGMDVNEARQADVTMSGGNDGNGGGGPPDDNENTNKNFRKMEGPSEGQDLRAEQRAEDRQNQTPAIDRMETNQAGGPENDVPAIDRLEQSQAPGPGNDVPAIDRLEDTREVGPENSVPAIDRPEETQAPGPENDVPAIDRLEESAPAPAQDKQQAQDQQQER